MSDVLLQGLPHDHHISYSLMIWIQFISKMIQRADLVPWGDIPPALYSLKCTLRPSRS